MSIAGSVNTPYKNLRDLTVEDVHNQIVVEPATVRDTGKLADAVESMLMHPVAQKVYVVDGGGRLLGLIRMETILERIGYSYGVRKSGVVSFFRFVAGILKDDAVEFMEKAPAAVGPDSKVLDALRLMVEKRLNDIPVVDTKKVLLGELNGVEILARALKRHGGKSAKG